MADPLRQLSTLTLSDSFNIYLTFPGKTLTSFHKELCALKNVTDYVNIKTVTRWRKGESLPRETVFSPEDFRQIFMNCLNDSFFGREKTMFDLIADFLKNTLNYDISAVERAANVDLNAAFSALIEIISLTTLSEEKNRADLIIKRFDNIADGTENAGLNNINADINKINSNKIDAASANNAVNAIKTNISDNAAANQNSAASGRGQAVVKFSAPPVPFEVTYWLRHVKNGKDEFLSGSEMMPLNRNIQFLPLSEGSRDMQAVVDDIPLNIGFQFKCFAKCDRKNVAQLRELLSKHIDYSDAVFKTINGSSFYSKKYDEELELIAGSSAEPETVWFILPNYTVYVTFDPFINNYFLPEFHG